MSAARRDDEAQVLHAAFDAARVRDVLSRRSRGAFAREGYREAAVLVPIFDEPGQPTRLVLTARPAHLKAHAGQVSFPGGKREPGDADLVETALREAEEEVGIARGSVEVLGLLDDVPTPSGFVITPVVGRVAGPLVLAPNHEVEEVMVVPIHPLRGPAYRHGGDVEWLGLMWAMHEYQHGGRTIWGATARIVWQLLQVIDGLPDAHVPSDRER